MYANVGPIAGIPVVETDQMPYDEIYLSYSNRAIMVGETAQLAYRLRQMELNARCRAQARAALDSAALRILGEPLDKVTENK